MGTPGPGGMGPGSMAVTSPSERSSSVLTLRPGGESPPEVVRRRAVGFYWW